MHTETQRLRELTIRYAPKVDGMGRPIVVPRSLRTPADCAAVCTTFLRDEACEVFGILCLTTKLRFITWHEVSRGSLDTTVVHTREVFKAAYLANASAIVLAHNHPSGDPTPSPEDERLTTNLRAAGDLLGIAILDHLVIGEDSYVSFQQMGRW